MVSDILSCLGVEGACPFSSCATCLTFAIAEKIIRRKGNTGSLLKVFSGAQILVENLLSAPEKRRKRKHLIALVSQ